MIGKALGDQRAEHALDRDVDLGDEIDRALLVDRGRRVPKLRHLHVAGADDRFDGGGEKAAGRGTQASTAAGLGTRLIMRISMPPSGARCELHVVHEAADEEDAAAAGLQQVFGRQRIGDVLGVEALALVAHADASARRRPRPTRSSNSTNTCLPASFRLPCLMALMTDSRIGDADPVQRVLVEPDVAADVVADDLHEVQHLERAGELEPDDADVDRHGRD